MFLITQFIKALAKRLNIKQPSAPPLHHSTSNRRVYKDRGLNQPSPLFTTIKACTSECPKNSNDLTNQVILVDEYDTTIGHAEKLQAHREGWLHRAFSIFIIRQIETQPVEVLLQKRQHTKYHSGGLWTNTCCSHPQPGEILLMAGNRRLQEEMGITADLKKIGAFHYRAQVAVDLIENEFDHVLVGTLASAKFVVNPQEVADYRWISLPSLLIEIQEHPQQFTAWLAPALDLLLKFLASQTQNH